MTDATMQVRSGSTGASTTIQSVGLHLPSSIGHDTEDTNNIMQEVEGRCRGKITMNILTGDWNQVPVGDTKYIGGTPKQQAQNTVNGNDHTEIIKASMSGMKMRVLNSFADCWKTTKHSEPQDVGENRDDENEDLNTTKEDDSNEKKTATTTTTQGAADATRRSRPTTPERTTTTAARPTTRARW